MNKGRKIYDLILFPTEKSAPARLEFQFSAKIGNCTPISLRRGPSRLPGGKKTNVVYVYGRPISPCAGNRMEGRNGRQFILFTGAGGTLTTISIFQRRIGARCCNQAGFQCRTLMRSALSVSNRRPERKLETMVMNWPLIGC